MKLPQSRLKRVLLLLVVLLLVAQAVPYGRDHTNPPVTGEPAWDSPRTKELAVRACGDCHSNETKWPWYSHVAPISWLVQSDVEDGRKHFNFSAMDQPQRHADDAAEELEKGEMPPWQYTPTHPEAKLTDAEKAELVKGLRATFGGKEKGPGKGGEDDEDEHDGD